MGILKASIFSVKIIENQNLFQRNFDEILKELASKLDDINGGNIRIFDTNKKGKETSIWFDSFDYQQDFISNDILKESICFLLAKDIDFSIIENKENKQLDGIMGDEKIHPKIPSHCIYIPSDNIFIIEESSNSANIATIKRGIFKVFSEYKNFLQFKAKNRENIIERLRDFIDKIQSIEMIDLNLSNYFKEDEDGELLNIITNPNTKIKASLSVENNDNILKNKIVDFFTSIFENQATRELRNIQIKFKDENEHKEIIDLYNNLIFLKIEKEHYYSDIANLQNNENERIEYSKSIYRALIEEYNAKKQS